MNDLLEKYGKCPSTKLSAPGVYTFSNSAKEEMIVRNPTISFHHEDGTICMFDAKHRAHIIPKDFTSHTISNEDI